MKAAEPKVSILLPVFNGRRFLVQALDSIRAQTERDFELLAVDDGSTDGSRALLERFAARDSRIRVISRPNTGIVGALNDGLAASRAPWIARMDADDWCSPDRLAVQLAYLEAHPDCIAVGTAVMFTDPEGHLLKPYFPPTEHEDIVTQLCEGNGGALAHATCLFRRGPLLAAGAYRKKFDRIEDLDLFVRLAPLGRLANLPRVHYFYRQHSGSTNHNREAVDPRYTEITLDLRRRRGLPPLPPRPLQPSFAAGAAGDYSDLRRIWAFDALAGGHRRSAWFNLLRALARRPLRRRNLSALSYLLGRTFRGPQPGPAARPTPSTSGL